MTTEPTCILTIDKANVEFLPDVDGLPNVVTRVPYHWTLTPLVGDPLNWPGVVELGPVDPDDFIDVTSLDDEGFQDVVSGWVKAELGRAHLRAVKANMTAVIASRATETVKLFAPELPPAVVSDPIEEGPSEE